MQIATTVQTHQNGEIIANFVTFLPDVVRIEKTLWAVWRCKWLVQTHQNEEITTHFAEFIRGAVRTENAVWAVWGVQMAGSEPPQLRNYSIVQHFLEALCALKTHCGLLGGANC